MKTLLLILTLTLSALGCPTVIVTINGQVLDANGHYVSRATVTVRDVTKTANPFGYFSFDVVNCEDYVINVTAKNRHFDPFTLHLPGDPNIIIYETP